LLVSCASRAFSDVKCSSRSNRSSFGGGSSRNDGGNTYNRASQHSILYIITFYTVSHTKLSLDIWANAKCYYHYWQKQQTSSSVACSRLNLSETRDTSSNKSRSTQDIKWIICKAYNFRVSVGDCGMINNPLQVGCRGRSMVSGHPLFWFRCPSL